jgi:hypothetical protein
VNDVTVFAVLAIAGYAALYLLVVLIFPFRPCRKCHGRGTRTNRVIGGGFRQCTRCNGTGRAVRPGRRFLQRLNTDPDGRLAHITGDPRTLTPRRRGRR